MSAFMLGMWGDTHLDDFVWRQVQPCVGCVQGCVGLVYVQYGACLTATPAMLGVFVCNLAA